MHSPYADRQTVIRMLSKLSSLNVITFNCYGLVPNSIDYVAELCGSAQIIALQETWLYEWNLTVPANINKDFHAFSITSVDTTREILTGRPHGGLSFMWRKDVSENVKMRSYDYDRIIGLSVAVGGSSILFLNVYFPTDSPDNFDEYVRCLGLLSSIIESRNELNVCVLGDFNAKPGSQRFEDIQTVLSDYNVTFADVERLPADTYTHVNSGSLSHSWLDHIAMSAALSDTVFTCYTLPDVACSDHCVVGAELNLEKIQPLEPAALRVKQIDWNFANDQRTEQFYRILDNELSLLPSRLFRLNHGSDIAALDMLYDCLCQCILRCGKQAFGVKKNKNFNVPGWNDRARDLNRAVRQAVFDWNVAGRPRGGHLAVTMRIAKSRFRREMRFLKKNEEQLRSRALLQKLQSGSSTHFWKEVRKLTPRTASLPLTVAGVTGEQNIANLWGNHFRSIANCVTTNTKQECVERQLSDEAEILDLVTVHELKDIVKSIKNGKAIGNDCIPGEVFKHASPRLLTVMAIFLSACLLTKKLPARLMRVVVIPLLKCSSKDPSDLNNYRPIAIATSLSKVLEQVLLSRLNDYLRTADSQFGFKAQHGTEMAVFTLKQVVNHYQSNDSPVFLCFLDAKKAFDRVNHWSLFEKLLSRGAPRHIICLLLYWYREQTFAVKWGNAQSDPFNCTNGIRQGGQLSPLLYNVYTDDLNYKLENTRVGCYVSGTCVNSISYADDMVLVAPTLSALQKLVDTCNIYAAPHDIIYNTTKTVCMLVRPRQARYDITTEITLNGVRLAYVDEFRYLGHIICSNGRDDKDIHKQFRRQNAVGNMLLRRFSFAPVEVKIQLFKSYCYPIYGNALWSRFYQYSIRRMTVSYGNTFKFLMGASRSRLSSAIFAEHRTDHIKVVLRKSAYSLMRRLEMSDNKMVQSVCRSDSYHRSALLARWQSMIFTPFR